MRAGLVIYGDLNTLSGGYLYDRQLVAYLRDAGDTVEIVPLPWRNYGRHLTHNGSSALWRRLRDAPYDVLLQDELNHPSLFALNRRLRGAAAYPIVSIVHHLRSSERHPAWQRPLYRQVERAYLRSVDGFICNSETTQTAVERLSGRRRPAVVAYPAADHHPSPAAHIPRAEGAPLRILFVGNIIPRKGLHVLLAALGLLPARSWRLAIVGDETVDPAYVRRLRGRAAAAGLARDIAWRGRLGDDALACQFAAADVLAVPSSYEGFGIVYLEALAHGVPAIATTAGAAHEIIRDGENGFLVPPDDPAALAGRLAALHDDPLRLRQMRAAARARFTAAPTWRSSMARAREFLLRIAA